MAVYSKQWKPYAVGKKMLSNANTDDIFISQMRNNES